MADKNVVEKTKYGNFICQWVDDVLPLGEDRKTIFVPASDTEKLISQVEDVVAKAKAESWGLTAVLMSTLAAKYGDEVWEVAGKTMYDYGCQRGLELAKTMKIDPSDARSLGRVCDADDSSTGVKGEWIETGKKRAVKRELYCPLGTVLAVCPEICTRLFASMERGAFDAMGAKVKDFRLTKHIPKGDPYCDVVIELED